MDAAPTYSCPVRRHSGMVVFFSLCAVACAVGIGFIRRSSFGGALAAATAITGVVLFGGIAVVLHIFVPTRVEVDGTEVRLIAPRTETSYDPATLVLGRNATGTYAMAREKTGRVLARFVPPDPDAAIAAFTAAGVHVLQ